MKNKSPKFTVLKLALASAVLVQLLVACGGPRDAKLSEMNKPENATKLLEMLNGEERDLLQSYVLAHTMAGDIDYNKTVQQAIDARKVEVAASGNARANLSQIK